MIIPTSNGCNFDVVFGGVSLILNFPFNSSGWQPALSRSSAIFRCWEENFCFSFVKNFVKDFTCHPCHRLTIVGSLETFMPLKHLGFSDFQITIGTSFSPSAFTINVMFSKPVLWLLFIMTLYSFDTKSAFRMSLPKMIGADSLGVPVSIRECSISICSRSSLSLACRSSTSKRTTSVIPSDLVGVISHYHNMCTFVVWFWEWAHSVHSNHLHRTSDFTLWTGAGIN